MTQHLHLARSAYIICVVLLLISAAKLPSGKALLPNTQWLFALLAVMTAISLIFYHRLQRQTTENDQQAKQQTVESSSQILTQLLNELHAVPREDPQTLVERFKTLHEHYLIPFVSQQGRLLECVDQNCALQIVLAFSRGERLFNRISSAALDHCLDDVCDTYPKMLDAFQEAADLQQQLRCA